MKLLAVFVLIGLLSSQGNTQETGSADPAQGAVQLLTQLPRPIECRLSHPSNYRPYSSTSFLSIEQSLKLEGLSRDLRAQWQAGGDPSILQLLGSVLVEMGEPAEALTAFSRGLIDRPDDPALRNDQACAALAGTLSSGHPRDHLRALEWFEEGLNRSPEHPRLLFNRALVLQRLGLFTESRKSWQSYLSQPDGAAWKREAGRHLQKLSSPAELSIPQDLAALVSDFQHNRTQLHSRMQNNPEPFRKLFEEKLLFEWMRIENDHAWRESLEALRFLGQIDAKTGDHLLKDIVDSLASKELSESARQGLEAFEQGITLFAKQQYGLAALALESAGAALEPIGIAARHLASFRLAVCYYQTDRPARAYSVVLQLSENLSSATYGYLLARVYSLRAAIEAQYKQAPHRYLEFKNKALQQAEATASRALAGKMHSDLASTLFYILNRPEPAWKHYRKALATASLADDPRGRYTTYSGVAQFALQLGVLRAASLFQQEALKAAQDYGSTAAVARSLLTLGRMAVAEGRHDEALQILARGQDLAGRIPTRTNRLWVEDDILAVRAEIAGRSDPDEALRLIEEAMKKALERGSDFERLRYSNFKAEMLARQGRISESFQASLDAVRFVENLRSGVSEARDEDQIALLDTVHETFDNAIETAIELDQEVGADLELAERSRFRLFKLRFPGSEPILVFSNQTDLRQAGKQRLQWILKRLPGNAAIVQFYLLSDRILVWILADGRPVRQEIQISAAEVTRQVEILGRILRSRFLLETAEASLTWLSNRLLEPIAPLLVGKKEIIFVPDKILTSIPFSHLQLKGDFLFEHAAISIAPGAALAMILEERLAEKEAVPRKLLAVGNPRFDRSLFPGLDDLPGSLIEATRIQKLYPEGHLLSGQEATRTRLLKAVQGMDVFNFSGHARVDPIAPEKSMLLLAKSPEDGGFLTVRELAELRLDRLRLAVLAACDTAQPLASASEAFPSLPSAFLIAGAHSVLASLWPLEDGAASEFLERFHQEYRKDGLPGAALQRTRLEWIRSGKDTLLTAGLELFGALGVREVR